MRKLLVFLNKASLNGMTRELATVLDVPRKRGDSGTRSTDKPSHAQQNNADQERNTPSPRLEVRFGQGACELKSSGRSYKAKRESYLDQTRSSPRLSDGACSRTMREAPPHSPPSPYTLNQTQGDKQNAGRPNPYLVVSGQKAD